MSGKYARVQNIDFEKYRRVIVISDIHGDSSGLSEVLKQVLFSGEDALVIIGDMIEKGEHSLEVLRLVMNLSKKGNIFVVSGNNEAFLLEWFDGNIADKDMIGYVSSRDTSLLREMACRLQLPLKTADDLTRLRKDAWIHFRPELDFLHALPQILASESFLFVHAGLQPGNLLEQDYWHCLSAPEFGRQKHVFEKPVIVGHWPASNYCDTVINANAFFCHETNVISIDGGNSMKSWAQINCLIIDPATGNIANSYYDNLPRIRALDPQDEAKDAFTLVFPNTRIEVREKHAEESICYVPYLNREITVSNDRIYEYKQNIYCYDFTTYDLPVKTGDILSLCRDSAGEVLVKRAGIVGNYRGRYEFL